MSGTAAVPLWKGTYQFIRSRAGTLLWTTPSSINYCPIDDPDTMVKLLRVFDKLGLYE